MDIIITGCTLRIISRPPHGPMGSWLPFFNIYLNDLFILMFFPNVLPNVFANFTLFVCDKDLVFLNRLEHNGFLTNQWLQSDYINLNEDED